MKNKYCIALLILLTSWNALAQGSYKIEGNLKGVANAPLVLACYYYSNTQFLPQDTTNTDDKGNFVFSKKKTLPQGLYLLVFPDKKTTIQIIVAENQDFSFSTDTANIIGAMSIKGSKENEIFYGYQQFLAQKRQEAMALQRQKSADLPEKMAALQTQVRGYYDKIVKENASSFAIKLFKISSEPEIPAAPVLPNGKIDSTWRFHYFRNHFFDDFDFGDERLLRTPFFQSKIDKFIKDLTVQTADSLIKSGDFLIAKAQAGKSKRVLEYTISHLANQYENPTILGIEPFFIHIVEKYYFTGVISVSDTGTIRALHNKLDVLKPLLVGQVMPDIGALNYNGGMTYIHQNPAPFKVVIFYSPTCGHCRESAPDIISFYEKNKLKGVEIMAISIGDGEEGWRAFIKEFKWEPLINCYGRTVSRSVSYAKDYDAVTTPTVYILDENNKILARKFPVKELESFLNYRLKNRK
jgi:thiol-disulfide isomerase/thioredoxin